MRTVFFTGFPGFLGRELLPRLLSRSDHRAVCLVQARYRAAAEAARSEILQEHGLADERIALVDGDITRPDLGLGAELEAIARDTVEVHHLAAVYDLAVEAGLAHRVNVDGTRHVLDFCMRCPDLQRLHYVSTCYVSGSYPGTFTENDLQKGQSFGNHYEETKYLAEVEVRRRMGTIPTTIYRPAIVVGDSATGATQKFDGPYFAIRFILKQPGPLAFMPLVGEPDAVHFNVVPRDFVVDAIAHLSALEDNQGVCYQLADPEPLSVTELVAAVERETGKRLVKVPLPLWLAKGVVAHVPGAQALFEFPPHVIDYFVHPTHYATTHASRDLAPAGIRCPRFETYVGRLVDFIRANPDVSSAAMI